LGKNDPKILDSGVIISMKVKITKKIDEMYSTATSKGSGVLDPRLYDEYPGQKERAEMQGLQNFKENKTKKIRIKIKKNISKKKA